MSGRSLILHIGAPKCGSSALQTALTRHPDLRDSAGRRLRYIALRQQNNGYHPVYGNMVQRRGAASVYGYMCWPNFGRHTDSGPILKAMQDVLHAGQRGGWVPVLSCEGWINHPDLFAGALADLGHPQVDVVCFLRPPAEWVNAAWWQWGIWSVPSVDVWLNRGGLPYGFADHLERWAAIPNLTLRVRRSRPDAVQKFNALYGCNLGAQKAENISSPASLLGFLLRNRAYRETPHDARSEFIFQRWCPQVPGKRLWALAPRHNHKLRPVTWHSREVLQRLLPDADRKDLFDDPRWTSEDPYHDAIRSGISILNDPADLPALHAALVEGVVVASAAAGQMVSDLPDPLRGTDAVTDWDPVLAEVFDRLIALDAQLRRTRVLGAAQGLKDRLHSAVSRLRG